jgi:hypothetical protein
MTKKSEVLPSVTLTMSHPGARLSLRTDVSRKHQKNLKAAAGRNYLRPVAFRPHFSMGLVLSKTTNDFVPPQAKASGRQYSRYFRQAHFMTSSKKRGSEPSWIRYVNNDIESGLLRCQGDLLTLPERPRIAMESDRSVFRTTGYAWSLTVAMGFSTTRWSMVTFFPDRERMEISP